MTAIIEEKVPQIPKAAPLVSETNDEDNEAPEEEAEEANIDDNEEAQENDGEIGLIICNVCDQGVYKHPSGTWHDGWGCDWPGHEGENFNFTANDPVYGCSTILECNWGVCETCYQNYIVEKANEKENEAGNVFNVPQPEGTRSSYSGSNQYYCEVKNVRFEASTDGDDGVLVIEYNVRGDMSLGPLQDPSSSKILCGVKSFSPVSIKVYFKDAFQNCGELVYHISEADQDSFMSESVRFVFGKSGYSEAKLVMPNASLENQNVQLPLCSSGEHIMIMSDYHEGRYAGGFGCDICGEAKQGFRWFCEECQSDKCFSCEPMQVLPAAKCGCTDHSLERCSGNKYGSRNCDVCKRRQLQYDPEYYHCVLNCVKGGYDLCLTCASKQQAEFQAESQL